MLTCQFFSSIDIMKIEIFTFFFFVLPTDPRKSASRRSEKLRINYVWPYSVYCFAELLIHKLYGPFENRVMMHILVSFSDILSKFWYSTFNFGLWVRHVGVLGKICYEINKPKCKQEVVTLEWLLKMWYPTGGCVKMYIHVYTRAERGTEFCDRLPSCLWLILHKLPQFIVIFTLK